MQGLGVVLPQRVPAGQREARLRRSFFHHLDRRQLPAREDLGVEEHQKAGELRSSTECRARSPVVGSTR